MEASHNMYIKLSILLSLCSVSVTLETVKFPITTTAIKAFKTNLQWKVRDRKEIGSYSR